jgi:sugar lactone lactonase YvrE
MQSFRVIQRPGRDQLGEGLWWSARENAVYWVDILAPAVRRLALGDETVSSWSMPEKIGWVLERRDRPGFIAGLQSGFYELTLDPFGYRPLLDPEPELPNNRMNDAMVDHLGRIWAGTMDCAEKAATGALYRLEADWSVTRQDSGYLVTNGPALSPAHDVLYHADSPRRVIYRLALTKDGEIHDKAEFVRFPADWGFPDGMTVDSEGGLWVAHWGGGRISRFTPDGQLDRAISLPASQITNCKFVGAELDRMFVTSAATGRADEELAGSLFEVDPQGARGLAPYYFAG